MKKLTLVLSALALLGSAAVAETATVEMYEVNGDGIGEPLGTIQMEETPYGVVFTPNLTGLAPGKRGVHGFHVHANPDCGNIGADGSKGAALAAGGHFDPADTKVHKGPWSDGHLGDLPPLYVAEDGSATTPVLAPRIQLLDEISNRSLMIHVDGDNFSDEPAPLGGGGARMACGVIGK